MFPITLQVMHGDPLQMGKLKSFQERSKVLTAQLPGKIKVGEAEREVFAYFSCEMAHKLQRKNLQNGEQHLMKNKRSIVLFETIKLLLSFKKETAMLFIIELAAVVVMNLQ